MARYLLALACLGVYAWHALCAPLPKAKPKAARPPLAGHWKMTWHSGEGDIYLDKDGGYYCTWQEKAWVGRWALDGDTLSVDEARLDSAGEDGLPTVSMKWQATLEPARLSGRLMTGGEFALRKPKD